MENYVQESNDLSNTDARKEKQTLQSMERDAREHDIQVSEAVLENLLNSSGENDVTKNVSVEQLVLEAAETPTSISEEGLLNDGIENEADNSPRVQLKYLAVAESILERLDI